MKKVIIALIMCISFVSAGFAEADDKGSLFCNDEISDWNKQKLLQELYVTIAGSLISSRVPDETANHKDKILFKSHLYSEEIGAYSFTTAKYLMLNFTAQKTCPWKTDEEHPATPPEEADPEEEEIEEVEPSGEPVATSMTPEPNRINNLAFRETGGDGKRTASMTIVIWDQYGSFITDQIVTFTTTSGTLTTNNLITNSLGYVMPKVTQGDDPSFVLNIYAGDVHVRSDPIFFEIGTSND